MAPTPLNPEARIQEEAERLAAAWEADERWQGIRRPYTRRARSSACAARFPVEHTLARLGAERLWQLLHDEDYVAALGALTGGQAVQMVKAGPEGDLPLRLAGRRRREPRRARPIPTRASTRPTACRRSCGGSTTRCCAPTRSTRPRATNGTYWLAPIVADAEAGFGGPLNAFELMKAMIEAGAAGVHFEDQLVVGEEVRPPRRQGARPDEPVRPHARRRAARGRRARRADRRSSRAPTRSRATLLTSDVDERDREFLDRRAHAGGLLPRHAPASRRAIARGARVRAVRRRRSGARRRRPTSTRRAQFAEAIHARVPRQAARVQLLALVQLAQAPRRRRRSRRSSSELGAMGYKFQFVTLAGFHALNDVDVRARARLRGGGHERVRASCRSASSRSRRTATRRRATSARSAPATSTRCSRRSRAARARRSRSRARPRRRSSRRPRVREHDG